MGAATLNLSDLIGLFVGLILTLCVFSYIFGDNFLFRLAIHMFIGVSAGYAAVMVYYNVIFPQLVLPLLTGSMVDRMWLLVPLILSLLLFGKVTQRFSGLGNLAVAYLVGVGAAVAVGGALFGTIFPQVTASWNLFDLRALTQSGTFFNSLLFAVLILTGTLSVLLYFHFGARSRSGASTRRALWLEIIAYVGRFYIAVTFGALFAGVYAAALSAWIERWYSVVTMIGIIFPVLQR